MTRRLLATAVLAVATFVALVPAVAQDGYSGGWTDPAPTGTRDGKPLAYLDSQRDLVGQVSHPNGVESVSIVLTSAGDVPEGCDAMGDASGDAAEGSGQSVLFRFTAQFPCNVVYEVRATARAAASGGVGGGSPEPYVMPLVVAVAIPPQPVSQVDASLEVDGDDRTVTLSWPANSEPDLLGYVVTRVVDEERETLGQVEVGEETTMVDEDAPAGETATYEVSAVRRGPDDDVSQVPAPATAVAVEIPGDPEDDDETGDPEAGEAEDDAPLASSGSNDAPSSSPNPGALSSVNQRGGGGPPRTSPTTIDTGFSETIDYGEIPEGEAAAPPAGQGTAVVEFEFDDGSPLENRETMAMIAGGLALFVGSLVIVYVTRRAASLSY